MQTKKRLINTSSLNCLKLHAHRESWCNCILKEKNSLISDYLNIFTLISMDTLLRTYLISMFNEWLGE